MPIWLHRLLGSIALGFGFFVPPFTLVLLVKGVMSGHPGALKIALMFGGVGLSPILGALFSQWLMTKIPALCQQCGGWTFRQWADWRQRDPDGGRNDILGDYRCASCAVKRGPSEPDFWLKQFGSPVQGILKKTAILWRLPFIALCLFGLLGLLSIGAPWVFGMFVFAYVVMGIPLQLLVRVFPQEARENQPTPWLKFLKYAVGMLFLVAAALAPCRGLLYLIAGYPGSWSSPPLGLAPSFDLLIGLCGVYYGVVGLLREGLWRYRQAGQVANLPTSKARAAAVGLAEFRGVARSSKPGQDLILSHEWVLFRDKQIEYEVKTLDSFYLEDETGRIRVDPVHDGVVFRTPSVSLLTALFGKRAGEIVLTRRVERDLWPNRTSVLKDGDPVYVIGTVEAGAQGLVVRPSAEGRVGEDLVLHFLSLLEPRPRRDVHDVFFIADSGEARARVLILRGFWRYMLWALFWTACSGRLLLG